jgi:sulfatase maturation enzyme AslB (radical SAM superfamily)
MMGLDFFRRSVELAESMKLPGQRLVYTIQTNGTLIDDRWAEFLAEHGVLVGLSIDGPREGPSTRPIQASVRTAQTDRNAPDRQTR